MYKLIFLCYRFENVIKYMITLNEILLLLIKEL